MFLLAPYESKYFTYYSDFFLHSFVLFQILLQLLKVVLYNAGR